MGEGSHVSRCGSGDPPWTLSGTFRRRTSSSPTTLVTEGIHLEPPQDLAPLGLLAIALAGTIFVGATGAAGTGVPLGTAGNFAILAGSGITNTGQTTIVGDTGSSPTRLGDRLRRLPRLG